MMMSMSETLNCRLFGSHIYRWPILQCRQKTRDFIPQGRRCGMPRNTCQMFHFFISRWNSTRRLNSQRPPSFPKSVRVSLLQLLVQRFPGGFWSSPASHARALSAPCTVRGSQTRGGGAFAPSISLTVGRYLRLITFSFNYYRHS